MVARTWDWVVHAGVGAESSQLVKGTGLFLGLMFSPLLPGLLELRTPHGQAAYERPELFEPAYIIRDFSAAVTFPRSSILSRLCSTSRSLSGTYQKQTFTISGSSTMRWNFSGISLILLIWY